MKRLLRKDRPITLLTALAISGALVLAAGNPALADDDMWDLSKALERIDDAMKNVDDVTAQVRIEHVIAGKNETATGSGKVYFTTEGSMRVEVEEPKPRTILCTKKDLYLFKPSDLVVEVYKRTDHPERLEQYPMLGFTLSGTDLKDDHLVTLLQEEMVDNRKVLQLEVTPMNEGVRAAISKIQLWIDEGTWLPLRQKIFHTDANTYLDIAYSGFSSNTGLDSGIFKPDWPKGTKKVKK